MPRPSHRRCKVGGPGCKGVAHPSRDQCSICLNYLRTQKRAEMAEVKRRRAQRLSQKNRELISEVDLKEPQMRTTEVEPIFQAARPPKPPLTVREAVKYVQFDREHDHILDAGGDPLDEVFRETVKVFSKDTLGPRSGEPSVPEEEPNMPIQAEPEKAAAPPRLKGLRDLTDDEQREIIDAYRAELTTHDIERAYSINVATLYSLIHKAGVPLRSARGQSKFARREARTPDLVATSLREELPVPATDVPSTPVSTNAVEKAPPSEVVSGLPEWVVTYQITRTETVIVAAKDFNSAAAAVEVRGTEVISVARKLP